MNKLILLSSQCLEQLAKHEHKLVYIYILEFIGYIRQCSRCYKSEYKKKEAIGSGIQNMPSSTDRENKFDWSKDGFYKI